MTRQAPVIAPSLAVLPAGIQVVDRLEGLASIHDAGCAASIWTRQALPAFQSWIEALAPEVLPQARLILPPDHVRDALHQICDSAGTPDDPERVRLVDDIAALSLAFAQVMTAQHLRLRLDVVTTDACRKFHRDVLSARLVCTYRGTGTQFGTGREGADPEPIYTVPTTSAVVMRGARWSETPETGLLHRSPPIAGTNETRLLLVLDPIDDPENAI